LLALQIDHQIINIDWRPPQTVGLLESRSIIFLASVT